MSITARTTGWLSVERAALDARLPAASRFQLTPARWERCSMPTPALRSDHHRWCDADGTHISLFCWIEQIMEDLGSGVLPSRLHQRGQILGRGLHSLYVHFPTMCWSACRPTCCAFFPTRQTC